MKVIPFTLWVGIYYVEIEKDTRLMLVSVLEWMLWNFYEQNYNWAIHFIKKLQFPNIVSHIVSLGQAV